MYKMKLIMSKVRTVSLDSVQPRVSVTIFIILFFFICNIKAKNLVINENASNNITKNEKDINALPLYGHYCGLGHSNTYGIMPIDVLDRACQIHDICTSAGLLTCFCNEQLYWIVSNIVPLNSNMSKTKDSILSYIYASVVGCSNYDRFDVRYIIGSTDHKGFNYLPFYSIKKESEILINTFENDNIYFLTFDNLYDYSKFTQTVYINSLIDISDDKKIKGETRHKLSNYNLIYSKENYTALIHASNVTICT